ncbi:hypothetical protein [Actinomadura rubrisoli]|uniref:Uncharacterized protein n=1 Tax=Actinomadura rubrisoli TaxID=2530368 RepID=A0A4R5B6H0_9ACTN|nr:hypothetical protein [Actinomadura rubrisoli]TDD80925.1 hypothetical protein E1298_25050 [Actinomadura rubrisoli]
MDVSFSIFIDASVSASSIAKFVYGGSLGSHLEAIGENSLMSAKYALERAASSDDKFHSLRSVVTHLESAHVALFAVYSPLLQGKIIQRASIGTQQLAATKDFYTLAMLAVCDRYLEERRNMLRSLDAMKPACDAADGGKNLAQVGRSLLRLAANPIDWARKAHKMNQYATPNESLYLEFRANMEKG